MHDLKSIDFQSALNIGKESFSLPDIQAEHKGEMNLSGLRLNNAISIANELIGEFDKKYNTFWKKGMKKKIGLSKNEIGDESLILDTMKPKYLK